MSMSWYYKLISKKGFTLIEMMIVIVIIWMMTALLYPDYKSFMHNRRLQGAASAVKLDLMLARVQAISMNRDIEVRFTSLPSSQYVYDASGDAATKNIQTDLGYYDVTLYADKNPIFCSRGIARNTAGTNPVARITLRNSTGSKTVTVNIAGYVTIR